MKAIEIVGLRSASKELLSWVGQKGFLYGNAWGGFKVKTQYGSADLNNFYIKYLKEGEL